MITIVDYGAGNLRSVQKGFEKVGFSAEITSDLETIDRAQAIVLPGVGAFKDAVTLLSKSGLGKSVIGSIKKGRPFLGICLGLHLLFSESEEHGVNQGFGIIEGRVVRFPKGRKIPHMGWNSIKKAKDSALLSTIDDGAYLYFVHSYYVVPKDDQVIAATTDYGIEFVSAIERANLFAVQFHPEKSSELGLKILKRFGEIAS